MSQRTLEFLSDDAQEEIFDNVNTQEINGLQCLIYSDIYDCLDEETSFMTEDHKDEIPILNEITPLNNFENNIVQLMPLVANNIVSNDEYAGPYDFDVNIVPNFNNTKNPWVFSPMLNKVFMEMGRQFPVNFKTKSHPLSSLFIRVTPQYAAQHHAAEPVVRCIQHNYPADHTNKDVPEHIRAHVIRCTNSYALYLGNKDENQRLSLIVPFSKPQAGADSIKEMFYFVCMSSCVAPGINRRSLEVIFTLEDETGAVLGRKCLNVRICACPKRDKDKEESNYQKKNANNPAPKGKKRKLETGKVLPNTLENDTKEYSLNLKIVGKQSFLKTLSYIETLQGYEVLRHQGQPAEASYKKNLEDIQNMKNLV